MGPNSWRRSMLLFMLLWTPRSLEVFESRFDRSTRYKKVSRARPHKHFLWLQAAGFRIKLTDGMTGSPFQRFAVFRPAPRHLPSNLPNFEGCFGPDGQRLLCNPKHHLRSDHWYNWLRRNGDCFYLSPPRLHCQRDSAESSQGRCLESSISAIQRQDRARRRARYRLIGRL
jgi:hypothetical protein